ncbi:MAG: RluA family pseudouridine synthase, partial [Deltaproteobacteria bacterium]|nr:RluA family pseudouridine synthase [Deltaproteobacteria bacterium]
MTPRLLDVPLTADGMRLDHFLARRFADRTRSWLARGIDGGGVRDAAGRPLRKANPVRAGMVLHLFLPGIAPGTEAPPLPTILHEDDRIVVLDKPAGMLAHPAGTDFAWAAVSLARERWPGIDLVHRLDRDTSGVLVLARDIDTNRALKRIFHDGEAVKTYEALTRGEIGWDTAVLDGPIGPASGIIRIQMAVRPDGQSARTDVRVIGRRPGCTHVALRLHTGRTHQIRVHLDHAGFPLLGDRMYGVPPEVFLRTLDIGVDETVVIAAGAPRQALHARRVS